MGKPVIRIRRAELRDAEALHATFLMPGVVAGTMQLPYPSVDFWRKRLADFPADDFLLLAEVEGEVVGNAGLNSMARSARRRHVASIGMSVRDDWQGKGVGNALMGALVDLADNWLGFRRLELSVYTDNAAALALYRRFGFEIEGTLREYALRDGEYVDAFTMARLRPAQPKSRGAGDAKDTKEIHRKLTKTSRKRA